VTARVALVVGASRGIGAAVAQRLADDGHDVLVVGRDAEALGAVAAGVRGAEPVVADVSSDAGIERLVDVAERRQPTSVVAVARVREPWRRISALDPGDLGRAVEVHTRYLLALGRTVLPLQRRDGFGRWVFLSSLVASQGGPGQGAYAAHKAAVEALCRTLAVEEAHHGITANVVAPGFIPVAGLDAHYGDEMFAALGAMNATGRPGTPEEVAHAVSFLVDRRAGFITGATIPVDGGAALGWPIARAAADPAVAARFTAGRVGS